MPSKNFTITVNVRELMTEFIPKIVREYIQLRGTQEELTGTELTLTLDISGDVYSYIIKDGVDFEIKQGDIDHSMVHISLSLESMAHLADMQNIDMLVGMQKQLTRKKFDLLSALQGCSVFQIKKSDERVSEIAVIFNNTQTPKATLRLSMQDANLVSSGKESPVNLFMSGKMKIEGDITFAMKLQPLFTV